MTGQKKILTALVLVLVAGFFVAMNSREDAMLSPSPSATPSDTITTTAIPSSTPATVSPTVRPSVVPVSLQSAVLTAINERRSSAGVVSLTTNSTLRAMAQAHATDMVAKGYFSHTSPSGVTYQQRINASGYSGTASAENLGLTSGAIAEIVAGWMDSEGHRINMLNGQYVVVGIGVASGTWEGVQADFVVAVFGNLK